MDNSIISDCAKLSFADTPFPEVVKRLASAGARSYRADLARRQLLYYGGDGESYEHVLPLEGAAPIGDEFRAADVAAAVRAIQARRGRLCRIPAPHHARRLRQLLRLHRPAAR